MKCPQCDSEDVYLCSVAYAQGTSKTTSTTRTQGQSYGGGQVAFANASHKTTSSSQTAFAAQAAPPSSKLKPALAAVALSLLVSWGLSHLTSPMHPEPGLLKVIMVAAVLGSIWWVVTAFRHLPQHRLDKERWSRSWICARCGHKFVPESDVAK
jgi:hypothetical protein